jgi:hypothetical protein
MGFVDADGSGNGAGGLLVVTTEHDGTDAQLVQLGDGIPAGWADGVCHGKQGQHPLFIHQHHHAVAILLTGSHPTLNFGCIQAQLTGQRQVAQPQLTSANHP